MSSSPTRAMRNYSHELTDMSVLSIQDDDAFVAANAAPFIKSETLEGRYYIFTQGEIMRPQMAKRGESEEAAVGGYTTSTSTYYCENYSLAKDESWNTIPDASEVFDIEVENRIFLEQQAKMQMDTLFSAAVMQPSVWSTDFDGVASGTPSSTEILQWSASSGTDPQKDVITLKGAVRKLCGKEPNVMVVGYDVYKWCIVNSVTRDAIKYNTETTIQAVYDRLAAFFGVEKFLVAGGIYNTANKGATASFDYILNEKDMWLGYASPNPGKRTLSAAYCFAYDCGGEASNGMAMSSFQLENKRTNRMECNLWLDYVVVAADAGAFVDDCVG